MGVDEGRNSRMGSLAIKMKARAVVIGRGEKSLL